MLATATLETVMGNVEYFAVIACVALAGYIAYLNKSFQTTLKDIMEDHKEETSSLRDTIAGNTLVLQKLIDKMGGVAD